MKTRVLFFTLCAALLLAGCCKEEAKEPEVLKRAILVYAAGDNSLSDKYLNYLDSDIRQMREASKQLGSSNKLVIFVDNEYEKPYFLLIENGDTTRLKTMPEEMKSSDATTLYQAMKYVMDNYNAQSYGLVLWGHADGWIMRSGSGPRRAYGVDHNGGTTWMNIPNMAGVLERLPKLKFIFADCCAFLCVENAYELRNCADFIIGSPAEIPGEGAPYNTVMPALFNQTGTFYKDVVDAYFAQVSHGYKVPLAVVKTSEMENLAQATATTLASFAQDIEADNKGKRYPNTEGLIYYYNHTQFDMQDVMLRFASTEQYTEWKKVFDNAVPYRKFTDVWMANHIIYSDKTQKAFLDFTPTEERYGGLGMFVPQTDTDASWWNPAYRINLGVTMSYLNNEIENMQWYKAAKLADVGW
jgi:hypothetical protein